MRRLLPTLLAPLMLAACSGGGGSDRTTIAVIPKGTSHEFWKSVHAGAAKAADELDIDIIWKGPAKENDRAGQVAVVEDAIVRGVDAIVLAPLDDTALVPVAKDAAGQGIPVVVFDSALKWDGKAAFVATDNLNGGRLGGERLAKLLDGKGTVLMLRYLEGSASTGKREQGFLDAIGEHPGIEVVSSNQFGGATTESCMQAAENLLNNYPDVDGIFCPCEPAAFGMLRALQDSGRAGKVRFIGFDATDKMVAAVRTGEIDALVLQDPFRMGELAVHQAMKVIHGADLGEFVDTGVQLLDATNIDSEAMQELLHVDFDRWLGD
jgi:ribose transport system substrate-binding protein